MTDTNPMLDRIRALLAKAESTDSPAEAEALTAKATELIAKYGIEEALLAAKDKTRSGIITKAFDVPNPYSRDRINLLNGITQALGCQGLISGGPQRYVIVGYDTDVERIELLYTSLLVQCVNAMTHEVPPPGVGVRRWKRSFMFGFARAVTARLEASEARAREEAVAETGSSTALVLADRKTAVERTFRAEFPKACRIPVRRSLAGFDQGKAAGERADIGGTRLNRGGTRAIGG